VLEPSITYAETQIDATDTGTLRDIAKNYISLGGDGYQNYQNVVAALESQRTIVKASPRRASFERVSSAR
jgi:hypothetical protein